MSTVMMMTRTSRRRTSEGSELDDELDDELELNEELRLDEELLLADDEDGELEDHCDDDDEDKRESGVRY